MQTGAGGVLGHIGLTPHRSNTTTIQGVGRKDEGATPTLCGMALYCGVTLGGSDGPAPTV